ncbi:hypothetical protein [Streptomyces rimosus]|uniref:hypothetical protein n=1 Tax=Streptomyces rimosus TaxID=1927 RepID=UPI00131BB98A|nr:hypothetical protein [Streptomyces rimosus]
MWVRYHGRDVDPAEPLNEMAAELKGRGIEYRLRPELGAILITSGAWAGRMSISYSNGQGMFVAEVIPYGEAEWRQAGFVPPTSNARYFAQRTFAK